MELAGEQDTEKLDDADEEQISFGGEYVGGLAAFQAQRLLDGGNGTLHGGSLFVNHPKSRVVAGNSGVKAQVFIWVNIDAFTVF